MGGPLVGIRVVELAGIGPVPFACMMLADAGADVIRLERPSASGSSQAAPWNFTCRSRTSVVVDLKRPEARELGLDLAAEADIFIEGFRPGVAERLGLGPTDCQKRNQRLVYARSTGWGQEGPLADRAGHDINYIALTGALWTIGSADRPPVPPSQFGRRLWGWRNAAGVWRSRSSAGGKTVRSRSSR
jgi:alpha-methylacyl-CoA racemase